jgi:hypothetical protein
MLRQCLIALRLSERMGLDESDRGVARLTVDRPFDGVLVFDAIHEHSALHDHFAGRRWGWIGYCVRRAARPAHACRRWVHQCHGLLASPVKDAAVGRAPAASAHETATGADYPDPVP